MNRNSLIRKGSHIKQRTLIDTVSIELGDFHLARLRIIDEHDYTGVLRKLRDDANEELTDGYLQEGLLALKQYYAVALIDPLNEHAVSDRIDPFWHAHILHTRQYFGFCQDVFGQYIHHEPLNRSDTEAVKAIAERYRHSRQIYERIFGYINPKFYPVRMPDSRMICYHYQVTEEVVRVKGLFGQTRFARELPVS